MDENGIVVVTGASGAIGCATIRALEAAGYSVLGTDREPGPGQERIDIADPADIEVFSKRLAQQGRRVRGLVNVAGRPGEAAIETINPSDWDDVFAVNVRGPALMIRALLPLMHEGSSIVNFGSIAAAKGVAERSAYCASKAAVVGLTRAAAVELASRGIRVNAVCPGTIDSPWVSRVIADSADPEGARRSILDRAPMRRMGTVNEVAGAVVYLLSDDAGFVTGAVLAVDGGASAW